MNRTVNPATNERLFLIKTPLCGPSETPPARYEKYRGRIGNIQGLIKLMIPSKNAVRYAMDKS
jgi:hypothetical protein